MSAIPQRFSFPPNRKARGKDELNLLDFLGSLVLRLFALLVSAIEETGHVLVLLGMSAKSLFHRPFRYKEILIQFDYVGSQSVIIIVSAGVFTGMVSALQAYSGVSRYGTESLIGGEVVLALTRELGPVLSALMVVARVGSAMTAELGSMRITQQIDALTVMAVEPIQYLVAPRIVATVVAMPLLEVLFSFIGMVGAYVVATSYLGVDAGFFMAGIRASLMLEDVTHGLIKSLFFGLVISLVCCYKGFYVNGGARGVGIATTEAAVTSSVLVLISDCVITNFMVHPS
jgi:phospholipid/cholesterol/gamma-HCH transport system permease protein